MGRYGGAPTPTGQGEDCWTGLDRAADIIVALPGALRVTAPILRRDRSHTPESCLATAGPPEPNGARIIWRG